MPVLGRRWAPGSQLLTCLLLVALSAPAPRSKAESIFTSLLSSDGPEPTGASAPLGHKLPPASDKVTLPGDILLGGLFPIHMKGTKIACGEINRDRGIQRLEAMLYALDRINADQELLPQIRLGAILLDSCSSSTYALNQSLEFIRASINTVESSAFECKDGSAPRPKYGSKMIAGVIGGSYSEVSLQVANLLRLFRIPQVSYASTGTALSDKSLYDLFARTVPSDMFQVRAIADIVLKLRWTYVSLVSSEGLYGDSGSKEFSRQAELRRICIATHEKISPTIDESAYDAIVVSLLKRNATGVVLFTRSEDTRNLLLAVKRANLLGSFSWVAADGWGTQQKLVAGLEEVAWGALTVELQAKAIPGFDAYMKKLTPWANERNPWFSEYWQDWFECALDPGLVLREQLASGDPEASWPDAAPSRKRRQSFNQTQSRREPCSPNLRISESNGYRQETKVQFVVDAVYAMAHALHAAWEQLCGARPGSVCERLKELSGADFYSKYLLKVSFKDLAGSEVKFDEQGDGLGRYIIYNFRPTVRPSAPTKRQAASSQRDDDVLAKPVGQTDWLNLEEHIYTGNNEYEYSPIGRWTEEEFLLDAGQAQFAQGVQDIPESFCSRPCELGQAKLIRAGDHCCWICKPCSPFEFLPDEHTCQDCGVGRWPVPNRTACFDLPQKVLRWDAAFSLVSLAVACLGIAFTAFVSAIFIKYFDTPVVKASGRELSFILLAGIAICHLSTFVLLSRPTFFVCGSQRFLVNFGFSLMYASLLVKTNRISRIFNCARKSAKRPSFISPKSQMLITGILVTIQIFLTIVWFILEPPGVRAHSPEGKRDEVILKCKAKGKSFILSLVYNMILITTCTVYAVKTRKIPENFNESKFIGFTMYTTIVIWLAFVTMFFGTNNSYEIQINTMCICISMSAYVTLFCLFSPKLSIILLHPDKNVRKLTMNSATYKRPFKPASSLASNDGRHYMTPCAGQPDTASGGPLSTTSNVLNLVESQARINESSVVSNLANSNSAGSNCSQRTPTTCTNCGAHQLVQASVRQAQATLGIEASVTQPLAISEPSNYKSAHTSTSMTTATSPVIGLDSSRVLVDKSGARARLIQSRRITSGTKPHSIPSSGAKFDSRAAGLTRSKSDAPVTTPSTSTQSILASLCKLNEPTSTSVSGEPHYLDASISSLNNDSLLLNTSQENTPRAKEVKINRGGYCFGRGSDSVLWNESLDFCSECCPSYCQCLCKVCNSNDFVEPMAMHSQSCRDTSEQRQIDYSSKTATCMNTTGLNQQLTSSIDIDANRKPTDDTDPNNDYQGPSKSIIENEVRLQTVMRPPLESGQKRIHVDSVCFDDSCSNETAKINTRLRPSKVSSGFDDRPKQNLFDGNISVQHLSNTNVMELRTLESHQDISTSRSHHALEAVNQTKYSSKD